MKKSLLIILISFCCIDCIGQQVQKNKTETQQLAIRKQVVINDLENQVKDLSVISVRVFMRFKMASWLWRDGKDETEEAERLTVKAIDELYEKKLKSRNYISTRLALTFLPYLKRMPCKQLRSYAKNTG